MRKHDKTTHEFEDLTTPFLPEESAEQTMAVSIELRHKLNKVEQQVLAQYTAMAAYAQIAQQNVDNVRAEARADMDRSQATVIGLVEKLRAEMVARFTGADHRAAANGGLQSLSVDASARMGALEDKLAQMASALEIYARENAMLKSQLAGLFAERFNAEGWLSAPEANVAELTLH
jgi:hypothetical protein